MKFICLILIWKIFPQIKYHQFNIPIYIVNNNSLLVDQLIFILNYFLLNKNSKEPISITYHSFQLLIEDYKYQLEDLYLFIFPNLY